MVHGSIENGKIFYSASQKGLAPYLAREGYDVFVADLRGRGMSKPAINKSSTFGLTETLSEEFPAFINKIKEIKGNVPQHWVAHSWAGVLFLAYIARNQDACLPNLPRFYRGKRQVGGRQEVKVSSMVFFGAKRRISVWSWKKFYMINIMWIFVSRMIIKLMGYLPAKEMKMGADNETGKSHHETTVWLKTKRWLDWNDGFDYAEALKKVVLPPVLYLTGAGDNILGNPVDVKLLMDETGVQDSQFYIVGKANNNLHDYGHIDILTHPDAVNDHYPFVLDWMKKAGK
ncbi:MAG: alpha/beta hydrolase [Cytophagales bacterium]|nr:alpha/beta hydrolase [Cytophagales bacterium]